MLTGQACLIRMTTGRFALLCLVPTCLELHPNPLTTAYLVRGNAAFPQQLLLQMPPTYMLGTLAPTTSLTLPV